MFNLRRVEMNGFLLSLGLHLITGVTLAFFHLHAQIDNPKLLIESVLDSERTEEEFTRDLNSDTEVSETLNIVPGGQVTGSVSAALSTGGGGSGGTGSGGLAGGGNGVGSKLEGSSQFRDPSLNISIGDPGLPGLGELGQDLGSVQIKGDAQAVTEGYGPALGRIARTPQVVARRKIDGRLVV